MGFITQNTPLTEAERDALNDFATPQAERERLYAKDLYATAAAYAKAADAVGLRKDAAKYLYAESVRLHREAGLHIDRADALAAVMSDVPVHTVGGKPLGPEGSPYGVKHDMSCPGCEGTDFLTSPRSETYWAS